MCDTDDANSHSTSYVHLNFICFFTGEPVPRSLEGLFVYEEKSTAPPANDTIVVEQWTVIEVLYSLQYKNVPK